ncbi:MAG: type VI-A CRISPR-associated RNA-guided ribonuclease Cas13a, partial [Chloroflexi bacterium]|nr:type VI-A CRISPR-associated RNA-guided ribonuclease Cas13a [Chloroflexota bacterium]
YRTSAGQAEIKRNEAFVRIWRGAGALAQRTLTDWADPDGDIDRDILGGPEIKKACGAEFNDGAYRAKLPILFGSRAELFDDAEGPGILRLALEGWTGLRNGSFHFKGRAGFARALRTGLAGGEPSEAVAELVRMDAAERRARLLATLRAAHVEYCYAQEQLGALFDALANGAPAVSPLPRFRRVLARAENAWRRGKFRLRLPGPENRRDMEASPGRLARYIVLKTLYERAFPRWLEAREAETLNGWIDRAADRATVAARHINKDEDAAARMAGLVRLADGEGIADFTDRLAAQTASEYRVQRGYDSDPAVARKQAKHIEDLRCDVMGQAFEAYLADEARKLAWTMNDPPGGPLPDEKKASLETAAPPAEDAGAEAEEDWLARLYFLLHMLPVEAVGGLRHQLHKWSVLERAPDADVGAVERILGLYLDMHDAKFEGGKGVVGAEALTDLFTSPAQFRRVCPEDGAGDDGHVPWRGLREMLRFGGGEPRLMWAFREWPIGAGMVDGLEALEATVAEAHKQREDLHAKWAGKKGFSRKDKDEYRAALETVVVHRHLAAHVQLVNHARLHRLAMAVLARLADYAGLWERDLYFTTLALIRLENGKPEDVFRSAGFKRLREGRIVDALKELKKNADGSESAVETALQRLFGKGFLKGGGTVSVRRDLLHFNMLQRKANEPFNLTTAVNDTRRLMAYDRKLKNAVSRSIIELLAREGLDLAWEMKDHKLAGAALESRQAVHLGGAKVDRGPITEDLHGPEFTAMAAALFGGEARPAAGVAATGRPDRRERKSGGASPRPARPAKTLPAPTPRLLPAAGERVEGVLVEEKTRKGGWKAAVEIGG